MPAPQVESMIRKTPKTPAAPAPTNNLPQPPETQQNGKQLAGAASENAAKSSAPPPFVDGISCQQAAVGGELIAADVLEDAGDLDELVSAALRKAKRGRPAAFDEHAKGKLVALLALGLSMRQAASLLGVSHTTIQNTLQAEPALAEEITAARFQAQVQPLACVVRESRRSWKAATWLLKYLDGKIASHEETPDEEREREHRELEEDQLRREERDVSRAAREGTRRKQREAEALAKRRAEVDAMFPRRKRKAAAQSQTGEPLPEARRAGSQ